MVAFGAGPQVGEAVAGDRQHREPDAVARATRWLVVGERAWEAVRQVFDAEPMDAVQVKGKADPLRCWRIVGERTSAPVVVPFVGRDEDLAWLDARFTQVRREARAGAVTVVAPAGLGKSRLLAEFADRAVGSGAAVSRMGSSLVGTTPASGRSRTCSPTRSGSTARASPARSEMRSRRRSTGW